jgi:hypothetical protein
MVCRAQEVQKRGLLHYHPVVQADTPVRRAAVAFYAQELARMAGTHGFGHVDRKIRLLSAKAAAAYLSSYFVTGKGKKSTLQQSVRHEAMKKGLPLWLTPRLTMKSGITMRELRFRRFLWVRFPDLLDLGGDWIAIARRLAEFGDMEEDDRSWIVLAVLQEFEREHGRKPVRAGHTSGPGR